MAENGSEKDDGVRKDVATSPLHFARTLGHDEADAAPTAILGRHFVASDSAEPEDEEPEADRVCAAGSGSVLVPAATATSVYAHACELVAVSLADLAEYNQAVGSLTQVLPTVGASAAARSGRDGWTQQIARPADSGSVAVEHETDGAVDKKPRRVGRMVLIALACMALLAAMGFGAWYMSGGVATLTEPEVADVERVLLADEAFMAGFTSSDYVEAEPYELSDVKVTGMVEGEDAPVQVDATATLKNGFFESDCLVHLLFVHASQMESYPDFEHLPTPEEGVEWVGYVAQASASETRAVSGVTHDPEFPDGFEASFDAAAQTCLYERSSTVDLWFGARTATTPYTYAFDGRAWTRSTGEATDSFAYAPSALDGLYGSDQGDAVRISSFKIVGFDAASGSFTIEYRASSSGLSPQTVSGVISCQLSVAPAGEGNGAYRQSDGYVYSFSGEGSSTGGEGTSQIRGCLGLDGSIVFDFEADYTKPAFLFGDPSNESMSISGIVSRAE